LHVAFLELKASGLFVGLTHTNFRGTYILWMPQIQHFNNIIFKDYWPDCVNDYVSSNEFQELNFRGMHVIHEYTVYGKTFKWKNFRGCAHYSPENFRGASGRGLHVLYIASNSRGKLSRSAGNP